MLHRVTPRSHPNARDDHRRNPQAWSESGFMNSRVNMVFFQGSPEMLQELKDCEPLMAGQVFEESTVPA
jgi:hypothetical protein